MASVVIGPHVFGSKADAKLYIRDLLSLYHVGSRLVPEHFWIVMSLIHRHPEAAEKIGCGIEYISVRKHPEFSTKCFVIHREDGSSTDFSYITCIDARPKTVRTRFIEAMRYAIKNQITAFKWSMFRRKDVTLKCAITGLPVSWERSHVDHIKPFSEIAEEFLAEFSIEPSKSMLAENADNQYFETITDDEIRSRWLVYHAEKAQFRIVLDKANLQRKRKR